MMWDALKGQSSEGYNPLKDLAEAASPKWGGFAYDAASTAATAGSAFVNVPLIVDFTVTGISTTRSLFGVTVPRMDNSVSILGNVFLTPTFNEEYSELLQEPKHTARITTIRGIEWIERTTYSARLAERFYLYQRAYSGGL